MHIVHDPGPSRSIDAGVGRWCWLLAARAHRRGERGESAALFSQLHPNLPLPPPTTTTGVFLSYGKWRATIRANYRNQYLGDYETEEEAAKAFDKAAVQLYENPVLNFLPDGTLNPDRKKSYFAQQLRTT